jgi:hypothetical protein
MFKLTPPLVSHIVGVDFVVGCVITDELDEHNLRSVENGHYQSVLVAGDVEDNPAVSKNACCSILIFYFMRVLPGS